MSRLPNWRACTQTKAKMLEILYRNCRTWLSFLELAYGVFSLVSWAHLHPMSKGCDPSKMSTNHIQSCTFWKIFLGNFQYNPHVATWKCATKNTSMKFAISCRFIGPWNQPRYHNINGLVTLKANPSIPAFLEQHLGEELKCGISLRVWCLDI